MPPFDRPKSRAVIAWASAFIHLAACVGLLVVADGTETNSDMAARLRFVAEHRALWAGVWVIWMLTSASLLAFCLAWLFAMRAEGVATNTAWIACGIVALGVLFDFAGELALILIGNQPGLDVTAFAERVRLYQILSPTIANGLYCVGGFMLSVIAWRSRWLRGMFGGLGFAIWIVGMTLTIGALLDHHPWMIATGGAVMVLFIAFAACLGWRMGRQLSLADDFAAVGGQSL